MRVIDNRGRLRVASVTVTDETFSYVEKNPSGGSWRVKGNNFQIWNLTQSAWVTIFITGAEGFEQIAFGGADTSAADVFADCVYMGKADSGASWRVQGGNFQLYNTVTAAWYTLYIIGAAGVEQFALSAADFSFSLGVGYMQQAKTGDSWRIVSGNFSLWNLTQSIWQAIFATGNPSQAAIG